MVSEKVEKGIVSTVLMGELAPLFCQIRLQKRYKQDNMSGESAIDIINKLNRSGKIPRCPKGGKRFATGTRFG